MVSSGDDLPNPGRIVRFAGFNRMFKDEDDNVLGPSVNAFELRPDEKYLSVTWCEYFVGDPNQQLRCAVEAIRSSRKVGAKACFCIADVEEISAAGVQYEVAVRHVYHPEDSNPAHAGVYGIGPEESDLLEHLAEETWSNFLTKDEADALPLTDCAKSPEVD